MGVFGAFFGCIGDGGFNGCCSGARSGDDGSMLACISGRRGVIGFKVPMGGVLRAKKFALRGLMVGASAKKFALHAQNTPKSAFLRLLGELFCGNAAGGAVLGEFFRGLAVVGSHGASCVAPRPWQPAQAATYRVNVRMKGCCEASVAYRRVVPSCSCKCHGPNAGRQPHEATVASGKIG